MSATKTHSFWSLVTLFLALAAVPALAQERGDDADRPSKNGLSMGKIGSTEVKITYGRPKVKGREIFGGKVPYDRVWRAGANEATTITFSTSVTVADQTVPAGTYTLFYFPSESKWILILNKLTGQWGAFNYDPKHDLVRAEVEVVRADLLEELTYEIDGSDVVMRWADHRVSFTLEP